MEYPDKNKALEKLVEVVPKVCSISSDKVIDLPAYREACHLSRMDGLVNGTSTALSVGEWYPFCKGLYNAKEAK